MSVFNLRWSSSIQMLKVNVPTALYVIRRALRFIILLMALPYQPRCVMEILAATGSGCTRRRPEVDKPEVAEVLTTSP